MIVESLEGWILHKQPQGETSVRLTFFTREKGIITAVYRGGLSAKKRSMIQLFTSTSLILSTYTHKSYVGQLDLTNPSFSFPGSTLYAALYVNELLYHLLQPGEVYPEIFTAYTEVLSNLSKYSNSIDIEYTLRYFEWALLNASGYAISLTHDEHAQKIDAKLFYRLIPGHGFVEALNGIPGIYILEFAEGNLFPEMLRSIKTFMRIAINHALDGKPLHSRALYLSR